MTRLVMNIFAASCVAALGCAKAGINNRPDLALPPIAMFNAASYSGTPVADSQGVAFGNGFVDASGTKVIDPPTYPLPNNLSGVTLAFLQSNREFLAPLSAVTPGQINFIVPAEVSGLTGMQVAVRRDGLDLAIVDYVDNGVNPGIYTTDSSGIGCPIGAYTLYVKDSDAVFYEQACKPNPTTHVLEYSPLKLSGPGGEVVFLSLSGTGIRNHSSDPTKLKATVGSIDVNVLYAGPDAGAKLQSLGRDQINIELPKDKLMRGEYTIVVESDGKKTNAVRIVVASS